MPAAIADVDALQEYLKGVLARANHHAGNVREVALALAGAIVWRKDDEPIEVMAHSGDFKNVLWVKIGGTRYAFCYNHATEEIELREGSTHGRVLHSFSNQTSLAQVHQVFESL
jgi:hypothetical protein